MKLEELERLLTGAKNLYFIGIGGVSMSSLAAIAALRGYSVRGSDRTESQVTRELAANGVTVYYGHEAKNVEGSDCVILTAAIPKDNPERIRAVELGIPLLTRAEFLGWLMTGYVRRVGVAGTHGKSTTTSMLAEIYFAAGVDPTVVSGAALNDMGGCYKIGGKEHFLFEACEYTDSFLSFFPTTAVVTNVDFDHPDYFADLNAVKNSFIRYTELAELAVMNADDANSVDCLRRSGTRAVTYGIGNAADYTAADIVYDENGRASFTLKKGGKVLTGITLRVPGTHNVYDALAASAAAYENGIPAEAIAEGLFRFTGADRRFERRGTLNGAPVYDDYAHHPGEIKATLATAKRLGKRVVCVFQPHTFSRTAKLLDGFRTAFADADEVIFADIYAAREINTYGVSAKGLAEMTENGKYLGDLDAIASYLKATLTENDLLIVMGAGDVIRLDRLLLPSEC